jgi:hypothetical protein
MAHLVTRPLGVTTTVIQAANRLKKPLARHNSIKPLTKLDRVKTLSFGLVSRRSTFYDHVAPDEAQYSIEDETTQAHLDELKKLSEQLYAHDPQNLKPEERKKVVELRAKIEKVQNAYLQAKNPDYDSQKIQTLAHPEKLTQITLNARASAQARVANKERNEAIDLILTHRPGETRASLSLLSDDDLETMAAPCREEKGLLQFINGAFEDFIASSKKAKSLGYEIKLERKDAKTFSINTEKNIGLSYSVHDLMRTIARIKEQQSFGGVRADSDTYDGKLRTFDLSLSEAKDVKAHLIRMNIFKKEFALFFKEFLGAHQDQVDEYVSVAEKAFSEITESDLSGDALKGFRSVKDPWDQLTHASSERTLKG